MSVNWIHLSQTTPTMFGYCHQPEVGLLTLTYSLSCGLVYLLHTSVTRHFSHLNTLWLTCSDKWLTTVYSLCHWWFRVPRTWFVCLDNAVLYTHKTYHFHPSTCPHFGNLNVLWGFFFVTTYQVPYSLDVTFNSHCSHGSSCIIEVLSETDAILPLVASIIDYNLIPAVESDDLFTNTKYVYVYDGCFYFTWL